MTGVSSVESDCGYNEQGFLTNCNRFLTRKEAAEVAWNAGQLKEKPIDKDGKWCTIYSEDMW